MAAPGSPYDRRPRRVTGAIVLTQFAKAVGEHGIPASTLTDDGMVFTARLSGGHGSATTSSPNYAAWA